jgi:hypothetical protein
MLTLPIRSGSEGKIRVQFMDSVGNPIEATSVSVNIFSPELDPDLDVPTQAGLIPVYLGNGVFELTFTPTGDAGRWTAQWTGTIIDTITTSNEVFEVLNAGVILTYPVKGLQNNMLISIVLSADLMDTSGNSLPTEHSFSFTTAYTPLHSSVRKVKLKAGGILGQLPDDTINLAILEASLEAEVLTFKKELINSNVFLHARREYVTCMAASMLAQNVLANGGVVKSKSLADFSVTYDVNILGDLLNTLENCAKKWEEQVQAGGGLRASRNPKMVVKGELDPDRPPVGRGWFEQSASETPVGNSKFLTTNTRRWRTGWISRSNKPGGYNW